MMSRFNGFQSFQGYGMYGGFGWMGMLVCLAIIVLVVLAIVFIVKALFNRSSNAKSSSVQNRSMDILNERFARGEITKEEYDLIRKDL